MLAIRGCLIIMPGNFSAFSWHYYIFLFWKSSRTYLFYKSSRRQLVFLLFFSPFLIL